MVGLLLACTQISDEYRKSVFPKLHATIHWEKIQGPSTLGVAHNRIFQAASNRVRYISLIMEDAPKDRGKFVLTSQALQKCCPRLCAVKSLTILNLSGQDEHSVHLFKTTLQQLRAATPQFIYGSFHLRQQTFGFTCQYSDGDQDINKLLLPEKRFIHNLRFTMVFLYTRDMDWEPLVLKPEVALGPGTPEKYPEDVLEGLSSTEADMIAARPGQVLSWWSEEGNKIKAPRD